MAIFYVIVYFGSITATNDRPAYLALVSSLESV